MFEPMLRAASITLAICVFLAALNAVWALGYKQSGPAIACFIYLFAAFLLWRGKHLHAGLFAGIIGFALHAVEWVCGAADALAGMQTYLFYANAGLPLLLVYFACRACRAAKTL